MNKKELMTNHFILGCILEIATEKEQGELFSNLMTIKGYTMEDIINFLKGLDNVGNDMSYNEQYEIVKELFTESFSNLYKYQMAQGYQEMADINLRMSKEAFNAEHEAYVAKGFTNEVDSKEA